MISSGSFGSLCECPCHRLESGIAFCSSCYVVVCKTIRAAADHLKIEPATLTAPFKDVPRDSGPGAYEIGR